MALRPSLTSIISWHVPAIPQRARTRLPPVGRPHGPQVNRRRHRRDRGELVGASYPATAHAIREAIGAVTHDRPLERFRGCRCSAQPCRQLVQGAGDDVVVGPEPLALRADQGGLAPWPTMSTGRRLARVKAAARASSARIVSFCLMSRAQVLHLAQCPRRRCQLALRQAVRSRDHAAGQAVRKGAPGRGSRRRAPSGWGRVRGSSRRRRPRSARSAVRAGRCGICW